jgi:glycosyltransferase involved in cell wall biosynthesis
MPDKFRIAMVKNGLYSQGGVSSVCRFLYERVSSIEHYEIDLFSLETAYSAPINVRLLSPKSWTQGIRVFEYYWNDVPVTHIGVCCSEFELQRYMPRRVLTDLLSQYDLIQVVAGSPATANVTSHVTKPICLFMATLVKLERKPILQRASLIRKIHGYTMLPIVSNIERQALRRADHVFAETAYIRQAILPYVDDAKISIDTIGVDTQQFRPIAEEQRTDNYILSVGRFDDARKNVTLLFEAYAALRQRTPNAPRLVLAGKTAPPPTVWARVRELGIADQVEMQQGVPYEALVKLYQNAALYVLSSDEEGLGIVLLEAMSCATPVVATQCGGPDSVVSSDVGFLTPVGDASALADRMAWLLYNPVQRRQMGQAGRRMVEKRFANEVVGQKYLGIYDQLLGRNYP